MAPSNPDPQELFIRRDAEGKRLIWVADWIVTLSSVDASAVTVTAAELSTPPRSWDGPTVSDGFQLFDYRPDSGEKYLVAHFSPHEVRGIVSLNWRLETR